jgi:predicted AlkP superfamily phosphohydrolase/phosphomutase
MTGMRRSVALGSILLLALTTLQCAGEARPHARKVLILGVDGLDPELLREYADRGVLPNFARLMEEGDFRPLGTSMPPQSPVAWATFITGMDPGGHGIWDFVHRDPTMMPPVPYLSMSRSIPADKSLALGTWVIPLSEAKVEQLRKGRAFWQVLEEHGVPTTIFRMPANFPPVPSPGRSLSGMGTPDILGTPGTFSFYTTDPPPNAAAISGGRVERVVVRDGVVEAKLLGPKNTFRREERMTRLRRLGVRDAPREWANPDLEVPFRVALDATEPVAKFDVQGRSFVLREGEWSDWVRVDFEAVPWLVRISAIGRFYLQQARPEFKLYVSPLQINPEDPALPISTPESWSRELWEHLGWFYTQELPEDTKAYTGGIFTGEEFLHQAGLVLEENRRALDKLLDDFESGLLFVYFSSVDQLSHMLWRDADPAHPGHDPATSLQWSLESTYRSIDQELGRVLERLGGDTALVIMSDHGFKPFYWGVNLNTWLLEQGYVTLHEGTRQDRVRLFAGVDWGRTTAYGLGLNGLYLNLEGREAQGIVPESEAETLMDRLEADLLAMVDPRTGRHPVSLVVRPRRDFKGADKAEGPDLLVGYSLGYRVSWESPLGDFPAAIFVDNPEPWSADHCVDHRIVPGVLLTNGRITLDDPRLLDLTVAVLQAYGVEPLPEMIGRNCLDLGRIRRIEPAAR